MDIEAVAKIMDDVLQGLLDEKIYPYGRSGQFGNKVATGSLRASIMVVPTSVQGKVVFDLFANDYFQWVQSGRRPNDQKGGGVPIDAILDWMSARGIFATDVGNVKYKALQSQVSTAYIINRSRIKKGEHPLPMKVLLDWIKEKKVRFNIDLQKGMAFAIQKNIKKFGIRPANIEDKLYDQLLEDAKFTDALGEYTFEQFIDKINYIFIETKTN
jgi:hypothetical protein